jgi:hypothetical protein
MTEGEHDGLWVVATGGSTQAPRGSGGRRLGLGICVAWVLGGF